MRYLVTSDRVVHDSPGGGYKIAWELAVMGASLGHEVGLLAGSTEQDPPAVPERRAGVTIVRYRFPRLSALNPNRMSAHVKAAQVALRRYLPGEWDIVHSHMLAAGIAAFADAGPRARRLATVHSPAVLEQEVNWRNGTIAGFLKRLGGMPMLRAAEQRLYHAADGITVLSHFTATWLEKLYGGDLGVKTRVLPWWAEANEAGQDRAGTRALLGWPAEEPVFFSLRRMVPRMGLEVFVDAAHLLARRGHRFRAVLGGDGVERENLRRRSLAGPARERIVFLGRMSDCDVQRAYRAADLFVLPTRALECFGIIAVEALAAGCPVAGTRVGAIPEVIGPVLPQCLFDAGSAAGLADILEAFIGHRLALPPREVLRRYAEQRFGRGRVEAQWAEAIWGGGAAPTREARLECSGASDAGDEAASIRSDVER